MTETSTELTSIKSEEVSTRLLENRLDHLERVSFKKKKENQKLNEYEKNNQNFLKNSHLKDEIEQKVDGNKKKDGFDLDVNVKTELILSSEDDLISFAEQLTEIEGIKGELEKDDLIKIFKSEIKFSEKKKNVQDIFYKLNLLEKNLWQQKNLILNLNNKYVGYLDNYNEMINNVSELFIFYHKLLNDIEKEVIRLENKK
ncbi:hypothetical protein HDU92_001698 [Lobulomyces angularis]|nr:hypothetical protein HDU92_001698 [Lobulomyces angularis]